MKILNTNISDIESDGFGGFYFGLCSDECIVELKLSNLNLNNIRSAKYPLIY